MQWGIPVLFMALALPPAPGGASSSGDSLSTTPLTFLTRVPQLYLQLDMGAMSPEDRTGTLGDRLGLRPRLVEMSRYQCSILGADRGAHMALAVGTIGSWFGLWDEDAALLMTAAGATLGGIWGGTAGNASLDFRMRPVWDDR